MTTLADLIAIAKRHGLMTPDALPVPWTGAASRVYPVGDVVIKVPFDRPDAIAAVTIDAAIAPVAGALGVRAAELVAFDDSLAVIPVPFAIFRRVDRAVPLDPLAGSARMRREVWEEVGRQLALVHAVIDAAAVPIELRTFRQSPEVDPRPWVAELEMAGALEREDARWLRDLLDRIAPTALADVPRTLCHGDLNAANVLMDARSGRFRALIDWAGAGWIDPAWDFAGVPFDAVPWLLAGHRSVAPMPGDATAEARVCWCQAQMRLFSARNAVTSGDVRGHVEQLRRFAKSTGLMP